MASREFDDGVLIKYVEQATASGTLGGSSFTNALITITGFGDTSNGSGLSLIPESVTVSGVGTATLPAPSPLLSARRVVSVERTFGQFWGGCGHGQRCVWLGPVSGTAIFTSNNFVPTTMGNLNITASGNSTFTAAARIRDLDLIDLMAPEHSPSGGEYWSAGNSPPIFKRAFENLGGRANGPRGG